MIVAHNLMAMNAQRQFNIVGNRKAKSSEKLSSGYKINRAADDAAGLAISEKMHRQIRGLSQGTRNTMDGISLCQVADGALAEVDDMLHRITELSVKSANGTNSDADRDAIQQEIGQLIAEIDRIGNTTEFNERKIFTGDISNTEPIIDLNRLQKSFSVTGLPTDDTQLRYEITGIDDNGISINNSQIPWSSVNGSSGSFDKDNITPDKYSFNYNGISFSFSISSEEIDDVKKGLIGATVEFYKSSGLAPISNVSGEWMGIADKGHYVVDIDDARMNLSCTNTTTGSSYTQSLKLTNPNSGVNVYNGKIKIAYDKESWATKADIYNVLDGMSFDVVSTDRFTAGAPPTQMVSPLSETLITMSKSLNFSREAIQHLGIDPDNISSALIDCTFRDLFNLDISGPGGATHFTITSDSKSKINNIDGNTWNAGEQITLDYTGDNSTVSIILTCGKTVSDGKTLVSDLYNMLIDTPYRMGSLNEPKKVANIVMSPAPTDVALDKITMPSIGNGSVINPDEKGIWIQSGAEAGVGMYLHIDEMNTKLLGINDLDASTIEGANDAIDAVKGALEKVSSNRSKIGAQQNRLEHTVKNNDNVVENTQAAESQIRDTDMSKEMVQNSMLEMLSQAGISMMSQANQSNQGVLSLLQ